MSRLDSRRERGGSSGKCNSSNVLFASCLHSVCYGACFSLKNVRKWLFPAPDMDTSEWSFPIVFAFFCCRVILDPRKVSKMLGKDHSEVSIQRAIWTPPSGLFRVFLRVLPPRPDPWNGHLRPKMQKYSEKTTRRCPVVTGLYNTIYVTCGFKHTSDLAGAGVGGWVGGEALVL